MGAVGIVLHNFSVSRRLITALAFEGFSRDSGGYRVFHATQVEPGDTEIVIARERGILHRSQRKRTTKSFKLHPIY